MQAVSNSNFGPLVAYLIPGATVLFGLAWHVPTLQRWFATTPVDAPTISGFLYLTLASMAAGMTVSAIRWAVVDTLNAMTGLPMPKWDFSKLGVNVAALSLLIEIHYRHYLFYANMLVATAIGYCCYRLKVGSLQLSWGDAGVVAIEVIFFAMARDCLRKYYFRGHQVLPSRQPLRETRRPSLPARES